MNRPTLLALLAAALALAGCDLLGLESAEAVAARKEAEGKAVGAACRHAARALEDCYVQNRKADKAAVFAGWREMNDYMREHKIDAVVPQHDTATAAADVAARALPAASAAADGAAPESAGPARGRRPEGAARSSPDEAPAEAPPAAPSTS